MDSDYYNVCLLWISINNILLSTPADRNYRSNAADRASNLTYSVQNNSKAARYETLNLHTMIGCPSEDGGRPSNKGLFLEHKTTSDYLFRNNYHRLRSILIVFFPGHYPEIVGFYSSLHV